MAALSKLHIRNIQTINSGTLASVSDEKITQKFDNVYIANPSTIYLANPQSEETEMSQKALHGDKLRLSFKKEVVCEGTGEIVSKNSGNFEDMALFFSIDASKIDHIVVFSIESII